MRAIARSLSELFSHLSFSKSKSTDLCFDAGGNDISSQSKRDVGVQLAVTITYSNSCTRGQWCLIAHDSSGPTETQIRYTIQVKYCALHSGCLSHGLQLFHMVERRRLQGKSRAVGPSTRLQHSNLRLNVWNSRSSNTGCFSTSAHMCTAPLLFIAIVCLTSFFQFFTSGWRNPHHRRSHNHFKSNDSIRSACSCIPGEAFLLRQNSLALTPKH
jgi:hypothetical protein